MTNVSYNELIGEFEAEMGLEEKAAALQSQIKMIKADIAERQKNFAQDHEANKKDISKAYKYWKEAREQDDPAAASEDFFTLCVIIDGGIAQDNKSEA